MYSYDSLYYLTCNLIEQRIEEKHRREKEKGTMTYFSNLENYVEMYIIFKKTKTCTHMTLCIFCLVI
jgi:hypothetical protein